MANLLMILFHEEVEITNKATILFFFNFFLVLFTVNGVDLEIVATISNQSTIHNLQL